MTFNIHKKSQGLMDSFTPDLVLPPGVNPIDAQFLWNNVYKDNPNVSYASIQDMVNDLEAEGINREMASWSNPEQVADTIQPSESLQNATEQMTEVLSQSKPFNMKKKAQAQEYQSHEPANYMAEQMDQHSQEMDMMNPANQRVQFRTIEDFRNWLDSTDTSQVLQEIVGPKTDHLKEAVEQYYASMDEGEKGQIAAKIFSDPFFPLREEQEIMGKYKAFGAVDKIIQRIAQSTAKEHKDKTFNLKKTAQHKTMDNAILWGPGQSQIDPFLKQPVSDWHIVERNKGFGLVVDDVWNIDYETIWRENIMDKYSRPYKDKDGAWVGGYLNKRFEIDRNIPDENNMQLKPGQTRKPILPEYGNTESRLQAARAAGDIEGAIDTSEPFNWKEASKKKS